MFAQIDGWMNGQKNGWMDGQIDKWIDRWTNRQKLTTEFLNYNGNIKIHKHNNSVSLRVLKGKNNAYFDDNMHSMLHKM